MIQRQDQLEKVVAVSYKVVAVLLHSVTFIQYSYPNNVVQAQAL